MKQKMEQLVAAIRRLKAVIHNDRAERKVKQAKTDSLLAKMIASQEWMIAKMDAWLAE
jgi:hypothetical protein